MYKHTSHYGTRFECENRNLSSPIKVIHDPDISQEKLIKDVAEFIGDHAVHIWPTITGGFSGYDTLQFQFVKLNRIF